MLPTVNEFFCLKDGRENFDIDKVKDASLILGDQQVKKTVDKMLRSSQISGKPPRLVWTGTFGVGKTHHLNYTKETIKRKGFPFKVIKFDCPDIRIKTSFNELQFKLVNEIGFDYIRPLIISQYSADRDWVDNMDLSEDVATALDRLNDRTDKEAKKAWSYLSGQPQAKDTNIGASKKQLDESSEFAAVLSALGFVIKQQSDDKATLLYLIDEVEGIKDITNPDAQSVWRKSLRRLVEIDSLGVIFSIGAEHQKQIPQLMQSPDVVRRIGTSNYIMLQPYEESATEDFLKGLFAEFVDVNKLSALESSENLTSIPNYDRTTYPFTSNALEGYCKYLVRERRNAKPSEFLIKLGNTAEEAIDEGQRVIDRTFLENRGEFD